MALLAVKFVGKKVDYEVGLIEIKNITAIMAKTNVRRPKIETIKIDKISENKI